MDQHIEPEELRSVFDNGASLFRLDLIQFLDSAQKIFRQTDFFVAEHDIR